MYFKWFECQWNNFSWWYMLFPVFWVTKSWGWSCQFSKIITYFYPTNPESQTVNRLKRKKSTLSDKNVEVKHLGDFETGKLLVAQNVSVEKVGGTFAKFHHFPLTKQFPPNFCKKHRFCFDTFFCLPASNKGIGAHKMFCLSKVLTENSFGRKKFRHKLRFLAILSNEFLSDNLYSIFLYSILLVST